LETVNGQVLTLGVDAALTDRVRRADRGMLRESERFLPRRTAEESEYRFLAPYPSPKKLKTNFDPISHKDMLVIANDRLQIALPSLERFKDAIEGVISAANVGPDATRR
jgi:hypothetical protein